MRCHHRLLQPVGDPRPQLSPPITWLTLPITPVSSIDLLPVFARNAGHFAPATAALFSTLTKPLAEGGAGVSEVEAIRIILSERENYELAQEIIRKEGLDVDLVCAELAEGLSPCSPSARPVRVGLTLSTPVLLVSLLPNPCSLSK